MVTAFQRAVGAGVKSRVRKGMSPQRALAAAAREASKKLGKRKGRKTTATKRRRRRSKR